MLRAAPRRSAKASRRHRRKPSKMPERAMARRWPSDRLELFGSAANCTFRRYMRLRRFRADSSPGGVTPRGTNPLLAVRGSHRHCFSSAVHAQPGSRPSLLKAVSTLSNSRETLLSKLLYGSDWLKAIDPVENTAPLFGAVK